MGEIITFYSYKGGTGRSMAVANVGWILASAGKHVLLVDWDLEAPGLHRYLYPFLRDRELIASPGIIDMAVDFSVGATTPGAKGDWYLPYADVVRYAVPVEWHGFGDGRLDLFPAGQQTSTYATRVNSFNWDNFYERLGGGTFLEAVKRSMAAEYDYVLIDSRTGVSDTSGICTVQMPSKLVVCFTLNRQSIEGAAAVAQSVVAARNGREALDVFPVPCRVEHAEKLRLDAARADARERFERMLTHLPEERRANYWGDVQVFYHPFYAYEEVLATFGDKRAETGSLLHSMERLTDYITDEAVKWARLPSEKERADVLARYMRPVAYELISPPPLVEHPANKEAAPEPPGPVAPRYFLFAVSFATPVDDDLERFVRDLDVRLQMMTGAAGQTGGSARLGKPSRTAVCLISPRYLRSEWCGREFSFFREKEVPLFAVPWEPVKNMPPVVEERLSRTSRASAIVRSSGLRNLMRLERGREMYREFIAQLADDILRVSQDTLPVLLSEAELASSPNAFADVSKDKRGPLRPLVSFAGYAEEVRVSDVEFIDVPFDERLPDVLAIKAPDNPALVLVNPQATADDDVREILRNVTQKGAGLVEIVMSKPSELIDDLRRHVAILRSRAIERAASQVVNDRAPNLPKL
jgi:cellulose biosynthesis protein BcsQ